MFIYKFKSALFTGEIRTIVTSFPVKGKLLLEALANDDTPYLAREENKWKLVEVKA